MTSVDRRRPLAAFAVVLLALAFVFPGLWPAPARAHEFRPAVLAIEESEPNVFDVQWRPPRDATQRDLPIRPAYPDGCALEGPRARTLRCPDGLQGSLSVPGLEGIEAEVVVRIAWLDGRQQTQVLRSSSPTMQVGESAGHLGQVALDYTRLGIEHILGGIDHLLFVLGLLMLVGFERRLLWTITGFTLAHSITLAASVLGLLTLPQGPVEAVIAISILLVAVEVARDEPSLSREHPSWVAFGFGLLHGFGFSGALQEIGLPDGQLPVALLTFNVGVELGQLAVIAVAYVLWRFALQRLPEDKAEIGRRSAAYLLGTVATFWTIERVVALFVA